MKLSRFTRWSIIVLSNLRRVFLHCQHLVGFGFYTTSLDWAALGAKARNFLVSIPPGVRFLDWKGPKLGCNFSLIIKRICQSLIALRCSLVELRTPLPSVSFPKLTHFYLPVGPGVSGVLCDWQMPALTHLYVSGVMNNSVIAVIIRSRVTLRCVVREHGATPELIVQIPKVTPNLEEFTYHLRDGMELFWKSVRTHSSLQDIVVVIQHFISRGIYQAPSVSALCTHLQPLTKAHFPKLRGVTIVGLKIHSLHTQKRAPLDAILDAWNTFGIEAKFYDP
ncbi:hypothetical protein BD410DRAFT_447566 [Rickenella mellea]|uniref:F-box domain-containing protein n=1 Tax=Rickenella mellea TaxID=50990 RepID=A0A4Y7PVW5_9AGAM|nr:hypothetical protein BD410DRAFT_447566 [Rickenella mellea]